MNIVITGATSGIGLECAKLLSKNNSLLLLGRDPAKLENTINSLNDSNAHKYFICDLNEPSALKELVDSLFNEYSKIDGLLYCAGVSENERLRKTTYTKALSMMNINYFSFLELVRLLSIKKEKSSFLNILAISSISSVGSFAFTSAYAASKAAMESSIKSLAPELAELNTVINAIRPAVVDTPMINDIKLAAGENFDEFVNDKLRQKRGVINPIEIAKIAEFMFKNNLKSMSGDIISISSAFEM